jgi:cytochrome d ubiquinol oxidase subunit II
MGPVWEANHVWLIFVIVLIFTAFPVGFSRLSIDLFVPFHLVLFGITLRGAAFVFRGHDSSRWGVLFGSASIITPVLLGMSMGAVSVGGMRWLSLLSISIGALALSLCAYLAAVYLTNVTSGELREDFRRRALGAGTAVVALSILILPLWPFSLETLPILVPGAAAALASGWALWKRRFAVARVSAVAQVALLVSGWGMGQYPYLIYPDLTLAKAAASPATLAFVAWSLVPGAAILAPSLWFLFRVFGPAPEEPSQSK